MGKPSLLIGGPRKVKRMETVLSDGYTWRYTVADGEATITGVLPKPVGSLVIPSEIDGTPVRYIGAEAFEFCSGLTSITIPDGVTSIGHDAFAGCSGLTSVMIPDSVKSIGNYAFHGCSGLTSIAIPNSVTHIGDGAFLGCRSLASVKLSDGVTSIGNSAFMFCNSLANITLPIGSASIGEGSFYGCSRLENVAIPASARKKERLKFYQFTNTEYIPTDECEIKFLEALDHFAEEKDAKDKEVFIDFYGKLVLHILRDVKDELKNEYDESMQGTVKNVCCAMIEVSDRLIKPDFIEKLHFCLFDSFLWLFEESSFLKETILVYVNSGILREEILRTMLLGKVKEIWGE